MAKILIVEDEKLINNLIRENLVLVGHICIQAYDGPEASLIWCFWISCSPAVPAMMCCRMQQTRR